MTSPVLPVAFACQCGTLYRGDTCPACHRPTIPVPFAAGITAEVSTDTHRIDDTGFSDGKL